MTSAGKMDVHFSDNCGENVELSKDKLTAVWKHRYSGGIAFSAVPLRNITDLSLDLNGTGHGYIGVVTRNPATITNMRRTLSHDILLASEIKVHKHEGTVNIYPYEGEEKRCVVFDCKNETKILDVGAYKDVWLFLYIKFGDLTVSLRSDCVANMCYHDVIGSNIRFLDNDRKYIKLHVENPSAVCCLSQRLKPGQFIKFKTRTEIENSHEPSQCHIKLGIVDLDPSEIKSRDPESFMIDMKKCSPIRWTIVQTIPRESCDGEMQVHFSESGEFYFKHSSGIEGSHSCRVADISSGISVVLDVFRTEVTIADFHDDGTYECVDKDYDYIVLEAGMMTHLMNRYKCADAANESKANTENHVYINTIENSLSPDESSANVCQLSPRPARRGIYQRHRLHDK